MSTISPPTEFRTDAILLLLPGQMFSAHEKGASALPPGPQNRTHVITSLPHQTPRLDLPAGRQESGRYGSQGWPPLRDTAANPDSYTWSADFRIGMVTPTAHAAECRAGGRSSLSYAPASRRYGESCTAVHSAPWIPTTLTERRYKNAEQCNCMLKPVSLSQVNVCSAQPTRRSRFLHGWRFQLPFPKSKIWG